MLKKICLSILAGILGSVVFYPLSADEPTNYSTDFNKIIDGSKINPDSKSLIKGAISVAGSSELLWEK